MLSAPRVLVAVLAASFTGGAAHADPDSPSGSASSVSASATAPAAPAARHAAYVELLGKGGLWGVGYDYQLTPRWLAGAVVSYYELGGDRFTTFAPYLGAQVWQSARGRHRWFAHLGPDLERHVVPSPVPEWKGMTTDALGAELSTGYEYRNHVLVRAYAMASVGKDTVPGLGASLGWTF